MDCVVSAYYKKVGLGLEVGIFVCLEHFVCLSYFNLIIVTDLVVLFVSVAGTKDCDRCEGRKSNIDQDRILQVLLHSHDPHTRFLSPPEQQQ